VVRVVGPALGGIRAVVLDAALVTDHE
jgi:hypothetical protein